MKKKNIEIVVDGRLTDEDMELVLGGDCPIVYCGGDNGFQIDNCRLFVGCSDFVIVGTPICTNDNSFDLCFPGPF